MTGRLDLRRIGLSLVAPALALLFAFLVTTLLLVLAGKDVWLTWQTLLHPQDIRRTTVLTLNQGTYIFLSALAAAIGFRMNLFNIGVDGQYRVGAFVGAVVGGAVALPAGLHVALIIVVSMAASAVWAGIAGVLKVTRGVSEVISTIMLNFIATSLIAYFLRKVQVPIAGSNNIGTKPIPKSGQVPGISLIPGTPAKVYGLIFLAIAAGVAFQVVLNRTRFGFDLRATGHSASAAVASGVDVRRMVVYSMLLSGAVAGLVGMPILLGDAFSYSLTFPAGLGFTGIAVALLGRNRPVGIALAALLFGYLNVASNPLQILAGVSTEIVAIIQGLILLSVVIAYEVVRRYTLVMEQRRVARELQQQPSAPATPQEVSA
jgi:simple sugar transport system permease protein